MRSRKMTFHIIIILVTLLGCAAIASAQSAPLVYVSALGSDSNTGARTAPVRTISHALSLVQSGGEVVVLDSGDYDQFTVNKAVTVETAPGVIAIIPVLNSATAVVVNLSASSTVVLRGLTITTCGGTAANGIFCDGGTMLGTLLVEDCVINGQFNFGIYVDTARLFIKGTAVAGCSSHGIYVFSSLSTTSIATIERCRLEGNNNGLTAYNYSQVTVRDTVASGNSGRGMQALGVNRGGYASLNVERCVASGNAIGIIADASNGGSGYVYVSDSFATNNQYGFYNNSNYNAFNTRGNNTVAGNSSSNVYGSLTQLTAY